MFRLVQQIETPVLQKNVRTCMPNLIEAYIERLIYMSDAQTLILPVIANIKFNDCCSYLPWLAKRAFQE